MRANRKAMDSKGEIGIGTMIVFIAAVLVAAVAAAVMIQTSGKLQEKAQRAGDDTTRDVASNLRIDRVIGVRGASNEDPCYVDVYLSLTPGSDKINMKQLTLQWLLPDRYANIGYDNVNDDNGGVDVSDPTIDYLTGPTTVDDTYMIVPIRDVDGSLAANPAGSPSSLTPGDIAILRVYLQPAALTACTVPGFNSAALTNPGLPLPAGQFVGLKVVPEIGAPAIGDFRAPESYGADLRIDMG